MRQVAAILVICLLSLSSTGQSVAVQKSRKERLEKEIAQLEQQIKQTEKKRTSALNTLTLVRKKVSNRKSLVAESDRELKTIGDSMTVCKARIDRLSARLDTMTFYYNRLIYNAYKNRDARVWYMYILSSNDFGQAARRYAYLKNMSVRMNEQALRIQDARGELREQYAMMKVLKLNAQSIRNSRAKELEKLKKEQKDSEKLVSTLKKNKAGYTKQLKSKKTQVERLNNEIKRLIKAEASAEKKKSKPVDAKLSGEFASNRGKLPWPADGPVLEHFGQHNHPVYTSLVMPFNNGVNIGLAEGTPVKAVFEGTVKKIIVMPGYNKCVLVQHGEYFTFYCKLAAVSVKNGEKVSTGQTIGSVDTIDGQTQLHFQLWKDSVPQDPETWLK